jgi:hypothetical protein
VVLIGQDEDLAGHSLYQVTNVFRMQDSLTVVVNSGTRELRVFAPSGRLLRSFGGRGAGPEEFTELSVAFPMGTDSILAAEGGTGQLAVWGLDGGFGRKDRVLPHRRFVRARFPDGSLLSTEWVRGIEAGEPGVRHDSLAVFRTRLDEEDLYIGRFPDRVRHRVPTRRGNETLLTALPHEPSPVFATGPGEMLFSNGTERRIERWSMNGERLGAIRDPRPPRAFSDDLYQRWLDEIATRVPPVERRSFRRGLEVNFPEPGPYLPAYDQLLVDDLGYVWARGFTFDFEPSATWSVFSPDGALLGDLVLPGRLRPFQIGEDFILAVDTDDLDREVVVEVPLVRSDPGARDGGSP